MLICEYRVRYEYKSAYGNRVEHAHVCRFAELKDVVDSIKEVGYKVVGVDERIRDDGKWMSAFDGWTEVTGK